MTTEEPNFFEDSQQPVASDQQLKLVASMAEDILARQKRIEDAEAVLDAEKAALRKIQETDLPDLMISMNMRSFGLFDGSSVKVEDVIRANISAERKEPAHAWLDEHGHGDIIKRAMEVPLGRGAPIEHIINLTKAAQALGYEATVTEAVNTQTLSAFVREQMANGAAIPMELFGVYQGRKAVIKPAAKPRAKKGN